jgi:hypothetical protein
MSMGVRPPVNDIILAAILTRTARDTVASIASVCRERARLDDGSPSDVA